MGVTKEAVLEALRAEDVATHYGIKGRWHGRWMRSRRCATTDHSADAFGLARDGKWHCWSCDTGGDLLKLIAVAEGIDSRNDFPKLLEIAAGIAGVVSDDDFGGGKPGGRVVPAGLPPVDPVEKRLEVARRRAAWLWDRLGPLDRVGAIYAGDRGILFHDGERSMAHVRSTPLRVTREQIEKSEDLKRVASAFGPMGIAIPVRSPIDGALVDVRVRRIEPQEGKPKIMGMLGGVVREGPDLHGCYGNPHNLSSDTIIVVEGLFDYLTACVLWPHADVLGATDAGCYPLVARLAARTVKTQRAGVVVLVAQRDEATDDAGYVAAAKNGAGDRAVDEATKNVIAMLGSRGCAWVECGPRWKDLNEMYIAGEKPQIKTLPPAPAADDDFGG